VRPVARRATFSTYTDYRAALTTVLKKQLGVTLAGRRRRCGAEPVVVFSVGRREAGAGAPRPPRHRWDCERPATSSSAAGLLPGGGTCRCRGTGRVTQHLEAPARREEAAMQRRKRDSLPSLGNELGSGTLGRRRRRGRAVDKFRLTLPRFSPRSDDDAPRKSAPVESASPPRHADSAFRPSTNGGGTVNRCTFRRH
jgi:hypothetical protein